MGSIAAEPRALQQPPPRFSTVAWGTFVGVIFGGLCLFFLQGIAEVAGLVGTEWTTHEPRGALDLPFRQDGAWSIAANLIVGVGATCVFGLCIWDRVERAAKRPASLRRTVLILLAVGYVPFVLGAGGWLVVVGFVIAVFLIRRYAIGESTPWPRRARRALLAIAAALLIVPASYGAAHPLWYGTHVFATAAPRGADWTAHRVVYSPTHAKTVRVGIMIQNHARFSATVLGVSGGTPGIRLVGAYSVWEPWGGPRRLLRGTTVHPGGEQQVTLLLALRPCGKESRLDTLDRVTAHYRLFGRTFSQPIALAIRPTVSC